MRLALYLSFNFSNQTIKLMKKITKFIFALLITGCFSSCLKPPTPLSDDLTGLWRCSNAGFILKIKNNEAVIYRLFEQPHRNPWKEIAEAELIKKKTVFIKNINKQQDSFTGSCLCYNYRAYLDGRILLEWLPCEIITGTFTSEVNNAIQFKLLIPDDSGNEQTLYFHRVEDTHGYVNIH
jgi:hypothetical protein